MGAGKVYTGTSWSFRPHLRVSSWSVHPCPNFLDRSVSLPDQTAKGCVVLCWKERGEESRPLPRRPLLGQIWASPRATRKCLLRSEQERLSAWTLSGVLSMGRTRVLKHIFRRSYLAVEKRENSRLGLRSLAWVNRKMVPWTEHKGQHRRQRPWFCPVESEVHGQHLGKACHFPHKHGSFQRALGWNHWIGYCQQLKHKSGWHLLGRAYKIRKAMCPENH